MKPQRHRALIAIAVAGLVLRVVPLLRAGGPLAWPVDYDEAVYFSASALLFKGLLPYRDFVFVHPPGIVYFLGTTSWLASVIDPATAFAIARVVMTLVGALNIYLVGRIVLEATEVRSAALVAAALYATYPDVVVVERGAYLEPLLNLCALAMAYVWLRRDDDERNAVKTGLLCAATCAVKLLGGIWFLAALASVRLGRFRRDVPRFVVTGMIAGLLLLAPLALPSIHHFIEQTLLFHAWRSPDGIVDKGERLREILNGGHVVATLLAAFGVISAIVHHRDTEKRFFAVATLLTIAAFMASSSYWNQYNSHLAASECVLAGFGFAFLCAPVLKRSTEAQRSAFAALLVIPSLWACVVASRGRDFTLPSVGQTIRYTVPPNASLFTFDPSWSLAGGRLPAHDHRAPVIVDSYGAMLLDAVRGGVKFPSAEAAFASPRAQGDARARLGASDFVIMGWRGNWQSNAETRSWFDAHFVCVNPAARELCLFERWTPSHAGLALVPAGQHVEFRDGWYEEEGTPQKPWRWMAARSSAILPAVNGRAELEIVYELPTSKPATVTIAIDGRQIDRFVADKQSGVRTYAIEGAAARVLTIDTDRVLNPAAAHMSGDTRDLGLRVNRLVWMPAK